jgi:hypothetical protein
VVYEKYTTQIYSDPGYLQDLWRTVDVVSMPVKSIRSLLTLTDLQRTAVKICYRWVMIRR